MLKLSVPALPLDLVEPEQDGRITIWGHMLATEPAVLALLDNPIADLAPDELKARQDAASRGSAPTMRQLDPDIAEALGLPAIGLYPPSVLMAIWPVTG